MEDDLSELTSIGSEPESHEQVELANMTHEPDLQAYAEVMRQNDAIRWRDATNKEMMNHQTNSP